MLWRFQIIKACSNQSCITQDMAQTIWLKNRGTKSEFDNKHNLTKSISNTIKAYQINAQMANGSPIAP